MSRTRFTSTAACAVIVSALLLAAGNQIRHADAKSAKTHAFPVASVHFEQNASDKDVEVVFAVKGQDDGLVELKVVSPDGRTVIDFTAPDPSTLGLRQFRIETPEPRDVQALKAAYPEGTYKFSGKTVSGDILVGQSKLSHRLPTPVTFKSPAPGAKGVPIRNFVVSWGTVPGVAFYTLELEQDEQNLKITATLPASSASFALADGILLPGKEYQLGIGAVGADGNVSVVETSFTTGK